MKIGFIGCGNMGGAIAEAVSSLNVDILLYDKNTEKAADLADKIKKNAKTVGIEDVIDQCDFVFLGVKPGIIGSVLRDISGIYGKKNTPCLVSMAAGTELSDIGGYLENEKIPVIRIMPNMPVGAGKGMTVWCANEYVKEEYKAHFVKIMEPTGWTDELAEHLINAECAVAGCGPAFVYMFIEALADGGVKCGLPRDKAMEYALNTLIGSAESIKKTGMHPGELKDKVCSPGGSTIEGVSTLEKGAFRGTVISAVWDAFNKTQTLGKK